MKKLLSTSSSPSLLAICIWYVCLLLCLVGRSQAQNTTNATTDPSEASRWISAFGGPKYHFDWTDINRWIGRGLEGLDSIPAEVNHASYDLIQ